ncbi:MAG: polyphosphate polymerase domain-containing protein [Lachnospiraceae bacterium]|nr:polyphosphate polymerase domain-containing protein [Lachnospiraceae bacterium]
MCKIQSCFNRYEKKYLITKEQYRAVKLVMSPYMRPDEHPRYSIRNIYYDTEDYELIRSSLEKPVYKEKLRLRSYGVPGNQDTVFVELKKKYDGVVYKRRITEPLQEAVRFLNGQRHENSQIGREIEWFLKYYRPVPKAFIGYEREAWASQTDSELRITFDTALCGRSDSLDLRSVRGGYPLLPDDLILMEIKIPGVAPMWLAGLLSWQGIFPTTFSKYGAYYQKYILQSKPDTFTKEVILSA